jgi:hypothetical protein
MSGSLPPKDGGSNDQVRSYDRERWFVAVVTALGGVLTLIWLFWRLVPQGVDATSWNTLAKLAVAILLALAITAMLRFALAPLGRARRPSVVVLASTQADPDATVRRWITPIVFGVGSGAIIVLALGLVIAFTVLAADDPSLKPKIDTLLNGIFGAVLPIFATWVGTVIAFYFTSSNFQQAARIAREATTASVPQASVLDRMIPYDKIAKIERPRAEAREIHMDDVVKLFSPPVTRVIVFDQAKQPVFVIRQKRVPPEWSQHPQDHTIDEYLRQTVEGRSNAQDAAQFEFIPQTATIDDSRAKMASANCVDLFVTAGGEKTQPVLGWLTDDLVK